MINSLPWTNSAQNITEIQPKSSIIWSYPAHFLSLSSKKFKKSTLKKVMFSYNIFRETETPKNSIYFGKRKPWKIQYISGKGNPEKFNIFRETETRKIQYISGNGNPEKFNIFQETELSYISRNGNPEKLLIF